jgi:ribosomal protein S18 acetylase RimI-like enzyme
MQVLVRSALPQDEEAVAALWRATGLVVAPKDPVADFRFARSTPGSDVLVAADAEGRVRATVMVGHDGHRGWLYYVAADPETRGLGLGRRMVREAEDWLRQRGVEKAQLLLREANAQVVSFYEHLGFAVSPRIVMSKPLR